MIDTAQKSTVANAAAPYVDFPADPRPAHGPASRVALGGTQAICGACARWDGAKCVGNCRNDLRAEVWACGWFVQRDERRDLLARVTALETDQGRIAEALGCAPDADLVEEARLVMARLANADAARADLVDQLGDAVDDRNGAVARASAAERELRCVGFVLRAAGADGDGPVAQAREAAAQLRRAVVANVAILEAAREERR
jgi:hypothetical protein